MEEHTEVIHVDSSTNLPEILEDLGTRKVILEYDGVKYELAVKPLNIVTDGDLFRDYDPDRFKAALDKFAGTLSDEEAEDMLAAIYEGRDESRRATNSG